MILSDITMREYISHREHPLIEPFHECQLQSASYDVSISDKITAFNDQIRTIDLSSQTVVDGIYEPVTMTDSGYTLSPNEYILATLNERLTIPQNMTAHIRPRTRFSRIGIVINAQHCNPGYSGYLQLGIYNASPNAIVIKPNLCIAQVVFETLTTEPTEEKKYQNKSDSEYMKFYKLLGAVLSDRELPQEAKAIYDALLKGMGEM